MQFHREGKSSTTDHTLLITAFVDVSLEFKFVDEYYLLAINSLKRMWRKKTFAQSYLRSQLK